jgi:hypothetical protein
MWNGETDLPWDTVVDQEEVARNNQAADGGFERTSTCPTPLRQVGRQGVDDLGMEFQNWSLSQFMHGEQGALICTAKIVETVPWIDAKYYAPPR